jgi:hypothetical protein
MIAASVENIPVWLVSLWTFGSVLGIFAYLFSWFHR